jgi:hypothetical protein
VIRSANPVFFASNRRPSAALLCFALLCAFCTPARAHERDALKKALLAEGIPFRESIGGPDGEADGAWIWVESGGVEEDDGFLQSPDMLPSEAPVLCVALSPEREGLGAGARTALDLLRRRDEGNRDEEENSPLSIVFYDAFQNRGIVEFAEALEDPEDTRLLILELAELPAIQEGAEPSREAGRGTGRETGRESGRETGRESGFVIYHGARSALAPLSLLRLLTELLESARVPYSFRNRVNELYKLGISHGPPELEVCGQYGIMALLLSGSVPPEEETVETTLDILSDFFNNVRVEPGNADIHYSIYRIRGRTFFVSEQNAVRAIIVINSIFFAALLLSFFVRRVRMLFLLKTGFSHIWVSFLYFIGLFISMLFANSVFLFISRLFHTAPPAGIYNPAPWFFIELCLPALAGISVFFLAPVSALSLIPLVKRGGFYGFTAMLSAGVSLLFGIYMDITTAHFFAWMLIFVCLSMIWDRPALPLALSLLTLLRPGLVIWAAVETGDSAEFLSGTGLLLSLGAAVILFPPALSFMRSLVLAIRQREKRQRLLLPFRIGFAGFCFLLMLLWVFFFRVKQ